MERIGIFGGSFDPPHIGHIQAARKAAEVLRLDRVLLIPTATPPHKGARFAGGEHRLAMVRLACGDDPVLSASDLEIARGGVSYTYDTLQELSRPNTRLFFMCGTDMVLTFDTWYRFEEIFKLCYPVYVRRENDPILTKRIVDKITEYYNKYGVMFRRIVTEPIELSSTQIRKRVAEGKDISSLVPEGVAEFIRQNGLYLSEGEK